MPERQPRTRLTASARRAQLLDVGQRVFAAKGVNGTTVEELAFDAGITKPLIYEHFGGKDGLYTAAIHNAKGRLIDRLRGSVQGEAPPRERLEHAICALLEFARDEPDAFRSLVRDAPAPDCNDARARTVDELSEPLEGLFREQFEAKDVKGAPARTYAFMLVSSAIVTAEWWLAYEPPVEATELATQLVTVLWEGAGRLDPSVRFHDVVPR